MEAAMAVAEERRAILTKLRAALEESDDARALALARKLCGVEDGQKGNRTDSRVN